MRGATRALTTTVIAVDVLIAAIGMRNVAISARGVDGALHKGRKATGTAAGLHGLRGNGRKPWNELIASQGETTAAARTRPGRQTPALIGLQSPRTRASLPQWLLFPSTLTILLRLVSSDLRFRPAADAARCTDDHRTPLFATRTSSLSVQMGL